MNTDGHGSAGLGVAAAARLRRGYGGRARRGPCGAHEGRRLFRGERTFIANFADRAEEWEDGVFEGDGAKRTRFSRITVRINADTWGSFVAGVRRPRPMPAIGQPKAVRKAPDLNRRFRGWRRYGKKRPERREMLRENTILRYVGADGHGSAGLGVAAAARLRRGYGGRARRGPCGAHEGQRLFRRGRTFIANFRGRAQERDDGMTEWNRAQSSEGTGSSRGEGGTQESGGAWEGPLCA
jgi:hypothetical protein